MNRFRSIAVRWRPTAMRGLLAMGLAFSAACSEETPVTSVDRETFVATYVELRRAAMENPNGRISPERKEQILTARGLTEEDLLAFAEAWGRDVDTMAAIWTDVEQRLHATPTDTVP
jgi:hypothetical protein